jgi:hypothetical protein
MGRGIKLLFADVGSKVDDLALEVGKIDHVKIYQSDASDTGSGKVESEGSTQSAGSDEQDFGLLELELAFHPDLRDDDMAAIPEDLILR